MSATYPVGTTRVQGEQLSLSTTLASLGMPPDFHQATLYNSSDFRLHINPALRDVNFYDASASEGSRFVKGSLLQNLTDRTSSTGTGTSLDSSTTSDFLYLMFSDVIGGIRVVVTSANGTSSTLAATYRKNDDTWANLSPTDGTASGGATLAQTGSVTWTAPSDWKSSSLSEIFTNAGGAVSGSAPPGSDPSSARGFWMRLAWGTALDSDTEIQEIWALNKDANRAYFRGGTDYSFSFDRYRTGSIEVILGSSTSTLDISWVRTVY